MLTGQLKASERSVLARGVLDDVDQVVAKISDGNSLAKEHRVLTRLQHASVPGFVAPLCSFACDDDFMAYRSSDPDQLPRPVCAGREGDRMRTIVMPFYAGGSVRGFAWSDSDEAQRALPGVLRTAALYLCSAYDACGIVHRDAHLDNLMIVDAPATPATMTIAGEQFAASRESHHALWIDLEHALEDDARRAPQFLYHDIQYMLSRATYDLGVRFDMPSVMRATTLLQGYQNTNRRLDAAAVAAIDAAFSELSVTATTTEPSSSGPLVYDPDVW